MKRIEWAMNRLYKPERPIPNAILKLVLEMCREGGEQGQQDRPRRAR